MLVNVTPRVTDQQLYINKENNERQGGLIHFIGESVAALKRRQILISGQYTRGVTLTSILVIHSPSYNGCDVRDEPFRRVEAENPDTPHLLQPQLQQTTFCLNQWRT